MASYSKTFEDYFRIPILVKAITPISQFTQRKLEKSLYYRSYALPIDERYSRQEQNSNTGILINRDGAVQRFYFTPEEIASDWPEFQVIYKVRYVIGVIDESSDQKQIVEALSKIRHENTMKLIGILDMGAETYQALFQKENIIKYPDIQNEEFKHFIEPWFYNCLAFIESDICNTIVEVKKEDENNRTIVFNRMEDKFQPKIMKRKKKFRCMKLCGDYHLMLQLFKEAFAYYGEAEQQLRKLDDYLWILGTIQGKLACTAVCQSLNLSNHQQYIDYLINQSYSVAKKAKNWNFECENYLKIARLYLSQPDKLDQLIKLFMSAYGKSLHEDEKFLLFTVLGEMYEKCGLIRKKNYYYFLASLIHFSKKSELSVVLLKQIQKQREIRQSPFIYKQILQMIISSSEEGDQTSQYYLELLSKCGNHLSEKEIQSTLAELNFSNHPILELKQIDFIKLREFSVVESKVKPKLNRIGNRREGQMKTGPGFFMSWKKEQNFLFQENEEIVFKGTLVNTIQFPIKLKMTFDVHAVADPSRILSKHEMFCYLQPNSRHKFESKIRLRGAGEQIWSIDKVELFVWNFRSSIALPAEIKFEVYQKQPEINLIIDKQIKCEESSNIFVEGDLRLAALSVPCCLIKLNISVYYSVDVGFQENEIVLKEDDNFKGIDFGLSKNIKIVQSKTRDEVYVSSVKGSLLIQFKRLKVHRRFVSRVQFTLQYIRDLNTKYQSSKRYISVCSFFRQFQCEIEQISTPTIQKIYKNPIAHLKILQKYFKVKLRFIKLDHSKAFNSYKIYHEENQYRFKEDNTLTIKFLREKIREQELDSAFELKEKITWENIFNQMERGEMEITIPFHELMKQGERQVHLKIVNTEDKSLKHRQKFLSYSITSEKAANLSHEVTLNPIEMQMQRMYVLCGKSRVQAERSTRVENKLSINFSNKCNSSYQLGILFKDGWIYWHHQLLQL